jgi:ubiquinone/menaquinone biosynthesis C-methylase UbiE
MRNVDFDSRAATWDDPVRTARAARAADAIRARIDLARRPRALEFGAGTGLLSFALAADLGSALLVDTSAGMLEVAARKADAAGAGHLRTRVADLLAAPLDEPPFDLVYSLLALHHVADTPAILAALRALLADGGHLAIADLDAEDGSFHGPGAAVHHGFDRGALAAQLAAAGFDDVAFDNCLEIRRAARIYPVFLVTARAHPAGSPGRAT